MKIKEAREVAKSNGESFFQIDKACSKGHLSKRYVSNGRCVRCHEEDSKTEETQNSQKRYYENNKQRRINQTKEWKNKNSEKVLGYKIKQYGLSVEQFNAMLIEQNNACAICKNEFQSTKHRHIDHCHDTGKVRGLLCNRCNVAIGLLGNSSAIAISAAEYLK